MIIWYFISLSAAVLFGSVLGATVLKKEATNVVVVDRVPGSFDPTCCKGDDTAAAQVTIIEFSDMDCPFSRRNSRSMDSLKHTYPDRIRHCFRHFPLPGHEHAALKARAVIAAGYQGKAEKMRELLFEVDLSGETEATLSSVAAGAGLDVEKFTADVQSAETAAILRNDISAAKNCGVRSTPTAVINGYRIRGAEGFDVYSKIIDKLISQNP